MMIQILLSILTCTMGIFVLSVLLAAAYTAGVSRWESCRACG